MGVMAAYSQYALVNEVRAVLERSDRLEAQFKEEVARCIQRDDRIAEQAQEKRQLEERIARLEEKVRMLYALEDKYHAGVGELKKEAGGVEEGTADVVGRVGGDGGESSVDAVQVGLALPVRQAPRGGCSGRAELEETRRCL